MMNLIDYYTNEKNEQEFLEILDFLIVFVTLNDRRNISNKDLSYLIVTSNIFHKGTSRVMMAHKPLNKGLVSHVETVLETVLEILEIEHLREIL